MKDLNRTEEHYYSQNILHYRVNYKNGVKDG